MLCTISRLFLAQGSRGHPTFRVISNRARVVNANYGAEQYDYIKSAIDSNKIDWNEVKNNLLVIQGNINQKNVDGVLLKFLVTKKKFDVARSFRHHLKNSNNEVSMGCINGLLSLYYELGKQNNLSKDEEQDILNIYKYLNEKYKVLDFSTCEHILHALCIINEWQKALKFLDDIHLSSNPSHSAYSTVIATLFRNNKKKMALEYIERSVNNKRALQDEAYEAWVDYILRKYKDKATIAKYLNEIGIHISTTCSIVSAATARKLMNVYNSLDWNAKFTKIIKSSGECTCCKQKLDCLSLSKAEFEMLELNIKDKLIVGSDMFLKTSPNELDKFLKFVEKTAPYDIILDALNISYAVGKRSSVQRVTGLSKVVDYFLKKNKKILILGRKHMLFWQKNVMQQILSKTCSFFTDNISQDDPYFITAAILSGPHTDIVSKDLLRGHTFNLKDEKLRVLFKRWQWQHQWMVFHVANDKFNIQPPLSFTPCAQKNNDTWHLPYKSEEEIAASLINDGTPDLSTWLCVAPTPAVASKHNIRINDTL